MAYQIIRGELTHRFADPKAPAVKERGADFLANIWSPNLTFANRRHVYNLVSQDSPQISSP